ncbi:Glutamate receptor ionotropic kainate 3 [Sarcoptes scabiei]|nr:Glutamate receptor ionotropic kainate 3 [Sarcoptes scabiei]
MKYLSIVLVASFFFGDSYSFYQGIKSAQRFRGSGGGSYGSGAPLSPSRTRFSAPQSYGSGSGGSFAPSSSANYAATSASDSSYGGFNQQPTHQQYEEPHPAPEPYNFQYAANDEYGNNQYRNEEQDKSGVIRGSYGYTDANGLYRVVDYVADDDGFRASIRTNEPGGLTEPHPTTGSVENPADVQLSAEPVPNNVRQQQEQYASAGGARYRAGGAGGQASGGNYGGGHQGGANYASTSSGFGGGNYGGGSGPITQQKLRSFSEKY